MATHVGGWRDLPQEIRNGLVIVAAVLAALAIWQVLQAAGNATKAAVGDTAHKVSQTASGIKEDWSEAGAKKAMKAAILREYPDATFNELKIVPEYDARKIYEGSMPWLLDEAMEKAAYNTCYYVQYDIGYGQGQGRIGILPVWKEPGKKGWQDMVQRDPNS